MVKIIAFDEEARRGSGRGDVAGDGTGPATVLARALVRARRAGPRFRFPDYRDAAATARGLAADRATRSRRIAANEA